MMEKLFELIKTLIALAILGGLGWYGYTLWQDASPDIDETIPGASFNCRVAIADMAKSYACRDSSACEMTDYELDRLKQLEIDIGRYCD